MNAQTAAQRIERLSDLQPEELSAPEMRALVKDLRLAVKTHTGGHDKRTLVQVRDDILGAYAARYVAGPRLDRLPLELRVHLLGYAGAHSALTLECVSRSMQDLRKENDNVWSETLGARWRNEGSVPLQVRPRATPRQLFHAFATKRKLRTNILRRQEHLRGTQQLQEELQEDNPLDRLAFVLSLRCGSFLLRWDGTQAVCEAVLETNVDIDYELATLHVIDMQTFKCATICENLESEHADEGEVYLMVPDILRHDLSRAPYR